MAKDKTEAAAESPESGGQVAAVASTASGTVSGPLVYVGPNLRGKLHMQFGTLYKGGELPPKVAELCAADSAFAAMFVTVEGLSAARVAIGREGTILNRAAQAVARAYTGA